MREYHTIISQGRVGFLCTPNSVLYSTCLYVCKLYEALTYICTFYLYSSCAYVRMFSICYPPSSVSCNCPLHYVVNQGESEPKLELGVVRLCKTPTYVSTVCEKNEVCRCVLEVCRCVLEVCRCVLEVCRCVLEVCRCVLEVCTYTGYKSVTALLSLCTCNVSFSMCISHTQCSHVLSVCIYMFLWLACLSYVYIHSHSYCLTGSKTPQRSKWIF